MVKYLCICKIRIYLQGDKQMGLFDKNKVNEEVEQLKRELERKNNELEEYKALVQEWLRM